MNMKFSETDLAAMTPTEFRGNIRKGKWRGGTVIMACRNYVQANLTIVPKEYAYDFLVFCNRNPRPCPVIDITEIGNPHPKIAPEADLRTDLTGYRVFKNGDLVDKPTDITEYWRDDLVGFLLGCSCSFDWLLREADVKYRIVGAFITNIQCAPAGRFRGPMVVSSRIFQSSYDAIRAIQITSHYPDLHGAPVHVGNPSAIGIKNICDPDFAGDNLMPPNPEEVIMFWGCGFTPELTVKEARLPLMITQGEVDLFITDQLVSRGGIM